MPPHALGSGTISFGLVSIPIKLYTATSAATSILPANVARASSSSVLISTCNETVERSGLVKGYEFTKDQYVRVADDELKALEGRASKMIDILEFVPLAQLDRDGDEPERDRSGAERMRWHRAWHDKHAASYHAPTC